MSDQDDDAPLPSTDLAADELEALNNSPMSSSEHGKKKKKKKKDKKKKSKKKSKAKESSPTALTSNDSSGEEAAYASPMSAPPTMDLPPRMDDVSDIHSEDVEPPNLTVPSDPPSSWVPPATAPQAPQAPPTTDALPSHVERPLSTQKDSSLTSSTEDDNSTSPTTSAEQISQSWSDPSSLTYDTNPARPRHSKRVSFVDAPPETQIFTPAPRTTYRPPEAAANKRRQRSRKCRIPTCGIKWTVNKIVAVATVVILVVFLVVALGVLLPGRNGSTSSEEEVPSGVVAAPPRPNSNAMSPTPSPTPGLRGSTTTPVTAQPTTTKLWSETELVTFLASRLPQNGAQFLMQVSAPDRDQFASYAAIQWIMANHSDRALDVYLLDLFALANLYFFNGGDDWINSEGWLVNDDVCTWYGIGCYPDGLVRGIALPNNNVYGVLPMELVIMGNHLLRLDVSVNPVSGLLPSYFEACSQLTLFNVSHTDMGEDIGSRLLADGLFLNLSVLDLTSARFFSTLPDNFDQRTALEILSLDNTGLVGPLPSSLAGLTSLRRLSITETALTGTIPANLCANANLQAIRVDCSRVACDCCECSGL